MQKFIFLFGLLVLASFACEQQEATDIVANPHAEGFNLAESDEKAIAIADEVMEAMGGRQAWDNTRYIQWTFMGRRHLLWDKQTGRVRVESPSDSSVYLVNIFDKTGKVMLRGVDISQTDSLDKYVERGESIWINDSYWLLMPLKLKDSGVTLKYLKQDTMMGGKMADILQLTFNEVGRTPDNKYLVYVDPEDKLVKQWDFFTNFNDPEPRFSTPWEGYKAYGPLMLSGGRGRSEMSNINISEEVDESLFTSFETKLME